jgi:hypothetical protein
MIFLSIIIISIISHNHNKMVYSNTKIHLIKIKILTLLSNKFLIFSIKILMEISPNLNSPSLLTPKLKKLNNIEN